MTVRVRLERESAPDISWGTFPDLLSAAERVENEERSGTFPEGYDAIAEATEGAAESWMYVDGWEPFELTILPHEGQTLRTAMERYVASLQPELATNVRVAHQDLLERLVRWLDPGNQPPRTFSVLDSPERTR